MAGGGIKEGTEVMKRLAFVALGVLMGCVAIALAIIIAAAIH